MFSLSILLTAATTLALITLVPLIDKNLSPFDRISRMTVVHRIFSLRNSFLCLINSRQGKMSSESKALDELIILYGPPLYLSANPTTDEIDKFRSRSHRLLYGLYPPEPQSCLVKHHLFIYDNHQVDMYSVQNDKIDDWKNSDRPFIVYFRGGGFAAGAIETYSGFECHVSKDLNMLILHVDFGLVPEHPLAQTMNDVIGIYHVLLSVDPNIHKRIIGMGDSSGGMLWIYLLQWMVSNNKSVPPAVVLHSPWVSLDFLDIEYWTETNYFTADLIFNLRELAIGEDADRWSAWTDEEKEKLSPKLDSYEGFPPLYITAGTNEVFIKEIRTMTTKIKQSGGEVILDEGLELMHSFALFHLWSTEAKCVQIKIRKWIEERLLSNLNSSWT